MGLVLHHALELNVNYAFPLLGLNPIPANLAKRIRRTGEPFNIHVLAWAREVPIHIDTFIDLSYFRTPYTKLGSIVQSENMSPH